MLFKLDPTNLTWVENVVEEYMFIVPTIWEDESDDSYVKFDSYYVKLSSF